MMKTEIEPFIFETKTLRGEERTTRAITRQRQPKRNDKLNIRKRNEKPVRIKKTHKLNIRKGKRKTNDNKDIQKRQEP